MRMRSASPSADAKQATTEAAAATRKSNLMIVTRVPKFLRCLYDILHTEDPSILAWSRDGSFFQIFSTARLEDSVLPKYFKHSKFASFQRQLNNFGFRKWTKTQSSVCTFSHHLFVQRHPSELVELVIEQNEASSQQQLEQQLQDEEDEAIATARTAAASAAGATASPKKSATKKRKRTPDAMDSSELLPFKLHHASTMLYGAAGKELSFQEQLNFHVESWDLMPITNPGEWEHQQPQPLHHHHHHHSSSSIQLKNEVGNETPTSAAALNEHTFNFTMEELDDILFTTSDADCQAVASSSFAAASAGVFCSDERLFDSRFVMSDASIDTSVGFASAVDIETGIFLNEMFANPDAELWLPC